MNKRRPVFFFAFYILVIFAFTVFTVNKSWPVYIPTVFLLLIPLVEFLFFREIFFPFHFTCQTCKSRLSLGNIFIEKHYLCHNCKPAEESDKLPESDEPKDE